MSLVGVSDVVTDWRGHMVSHNGCRLFGATDQHVAAMREPSLEVAGTLDDLLGLVDAIVDCTPKGMVDTQAIVVPETIDRSGRLGRAKTLREPD